MYRPSMYNKHDETMNQFAALFNGCKKYENVRMEPNEVETYDNDGYFILDDNIRIGFDWEYRDRYFANCKLKFPTLGQYERKLRKPSIQISLQCDSTATGVAVGWHEDWAVEQKTSIELATDYKEKESGTTRYTKDFVIFPYEEIEDFKKMIEMPMRKKIHSSKVFSLYNKEDSSEVEQEDSEGLTLREYIQNNINCDVCGHNMKLAKNQKNRCYLLCSNCHKVEYLTPNHINKYLEVSQKKCPEHLCNLSGVLDKDGVHVKCEQGHLISPDEI